LWADPTGLFEEERLVTMGRAGHCGTFPPGQARKLLSTVLLDSLWFGASARSYNRALPAPFFLVHYARFSLLMDVTATGRLPPYVRMVEPGPILLFTAYLYALRSLLTMCAPSSLSDAPALLPLANALNAAHRTALPAFPHCCDASKPSSLPIQRCCHSTRAPLFALQA